MKAQRTLVVWCPDWPLLAAGVPPLVSAAVVSGANRVVACTAAARAEGVRRGLRRREAQGRSPSLLIIEDDPARDARVFEPVIAAVEAFTPRVEVTRPGACALATRGPSRYWGGDDALAVRLAASVDAAVAMLPGGGAPEVACRIGVADGPFAAQLAAHRAVIVAPGESAAWLAPQSIELLDDPELTDLLVRLGIMTLGALAALPVDAVVARFGANGLVAYRRAGGLDDRELDARVPPPELAVSIEFDPPADRVDTAAFAAKTVADGLCRRLGEAGLACTCVRIEAETEHGEHLSRVWRHYRAFGPGAVAERVRWQLDGWLAQRAQCGCSAPDPRDGSGVSVPSGGPCPGGVACPNPVGGTSGGLTLLRLVPDEVVRDDGRQLGFWGGTTEADERAGRALARIQGLLGPASVVTAVLGGGRVASEQVQYVAWGDPREPARPGAPIAPVPVGTVPEAGTKNRPRVRHRPAETPSWPGHIPVPSPAQVPGVAIPAEVVDATGTAVGVSGRGILSAAPSRVSIAGGQWREVMAWAGPWTADERWWDSAAHRRRARLQLLMVEGDAQLVALERGRWWVEATYD